MKEENVKNNLCFFHGDAKVYVVLHPRDENIEGDYTAVCGVYNDLALAKQNAKALSIICHGKAHIEAFALNKDPTEDCPVCEGMDLRKSLKHQKVQMELLKSLRVDT